MFVADISSCLRGGSHPVAIPVPHFDLVPEISGFNPSIMKTREGYIVSKRIDWQTGCNRSVPVSVQYRNRKKKSRSTVFLELNSSLNLVRVVGRIPAIVDVRLFSDADSVPHVSFLPSNNGKCKRSCYWKTHVASLDRVLKQPCAHSVFDACSSLRGRNHAFYRFPEWIVSKLAPKMEFVHANKTKSFSIGLRRKCVQRISLSTSLLLHNNVLLGIGHIHYRTSNLFSTHYTHFFFTIDPGTYNVHLGPEWCIATGSGSCDLVQFVTGFSALHRKNTFIITYGVNDCTSKYALLSKSTIVGLLAPHKKKFNTNPASNRTRGR